MMIFDWMIWESNSLWILKISLYLNRLMPKLHMWRSKKRPQLKIGGKHENPLLQENLLSKKLVSQVLSTITRDSTITRYTITRSDCIYNVSFGQRCSYKLNSQGLHQMYLEISEKMVFFYNGILRILEFTL